MLNWSRLLVFVPVTIILVVTPGPNTLYIIARGLHGGYRAGLISCLGILLATLIHIASAAVGLTVLLSSSTLVFSIIKYAGAAYLIWIGLKTLATRRQTESISEVQRQTLGAVFYQGFLVNLLNPKTAVFFLAFLPQFVDPSIARVTLQVILLGIILACLGTTGDCTYALLAGRVGKWLGDNLKLLRLLRFFAGCVYLGLGTTTALKTLSR
jgi:threonine/homoserine/homoserine lactone efflux protein